MVEMDTTFVGGGEKNRHKKNRRGAGGYAGLFDLDEVTWGLLRLQPFPG